MATLWSADRLALRNQLAGLDDGIASLYTRLIDELDAEELPVLDEVRCSVVSYYARELFSNLPDFLLEDGRVERRAGHRAEEDYARNRVIELTMQKMESLRECAQSEGVKIDGEFALALIEFAEAYSRGSLSGKLRDSITITGRVDPIVPGLATFEMAKKYLTSRQHTNLASHHESWNMDECLSHLAILESVLHARVGSFFQVADELGELVHEAEHQANEEIDDSYVRSALSLLGGYQHRRIFYRMLPGKKWAGPLLRNGAFENVPLDNEGDEAVFWPEGDYLLRVAEDCPDIVDKVCNKLKSATNPAVREQFIGMVSKLPVESCFKYAATISGWAADLRSNPWYVEHRELSLLVSKLLATAYSNKKKEKAERLFKVVFTPTIGEGAAFDYLKSSATAVIPSYCYREELEDVRAKSAGNCNARLIQNLVERYDRSNCESRGIEFGSSHASYCWRPHLTPYDDLMPDEYGDVLIDTLLGDLSVASSEALAQLGEALKSSSELVSRIAIVALSRHVERLPKKWVWSEDNDSDSLAYSSVVEMAQSVLDGYDSFYQEMGLELREFTRACLSRRGIFDCSLIDDVLDRMWELDLVRFSRMDADERTSYEMDDAERTILGAFMLAASLGKDLLTVEQGKALDEFERVFGPINVDEMLGPSVVVSWGYESPKSDAEILTITPQELLDFLDSWRPISKYDGQSVTGLANSLCEAVSQRPNLLGTYVMELRRMQPAYIGAYLRGMVQAVRDGHFADVIDAIPLCDWLAGQPFDEDEYRKDNVLSPQTLGYAVHDAARLVVLLSCRLPELGTESQEACLRIGKSLVEMQEPVSEHEMLADSTIRHAVHMNLLRGMGTIILTRVAVHASEDVFRDSAVQRVERLVDGGCDQVAAAALGASVPQVLQEDAGAAGWFRGLISSTCTELASLDCFLWSALSGQSLGHELFVGILEPMTRFLELVSAEMPGTYEPAYEGLLERIGIFLCVERSESSDRMCDPLWHLWRGASSCEVRRKVLRWACRQAGNEGAPASFLEFAMDYWDEVAKLVEYGHGDAEELTGIFLLARNPSVPIAWLRSRMLTEVRLQPSMMDVRQVNGRVAELAREYPSDALELLRRCIEDKDNRAGFMLTRVAVPVLAYCLESADEGLRCDAQSVMDSLGAQGMIGLNDAVRQYAANCDDLKPGVICDEADK